VSSILLIQTVISMIKLKKCGRRYSKQRCDDY